MSSHALAGISGRDRRRPALRRRAPRDGVLRLTEVPVAAPYIFQGRGKRSVPVYVWLLAVLTIAAHAVLAWYATHHKSPPPVRQTREVAVDFVSPPKPQTPEVEPPKPQPRHVKKQTVPQIQTAVPDTPAVADITNEAAPIAAPVVEAVPEPAPEPEKITAAFGGAGYLNNPPPDYPAAAARQGWEGTVVLKVRVLSTGKVATVEVQKTSGRKILDDAAIGTVRAWLFTPSKRGETPIDGWASVPIEFKLDT